MRTIIGLAIVFCSASSASELARRFADNSIHERVDTIPSGWRYSSDVDDAVPISLRAYIKQSHEGFLRIAEEVSNPNSPRYGFHLSADELAHILPSTSFSSSTITKWLKDHNITDFEITNDHVEFSTSVGKASNLLNAQFGLFQHEEDSPVLRTQGYSLPGSLQDHIDFVYPTVHFLHPKHHSGSRQLRRRQHVPNGPVNCTNSACPSELKKKYHISYFPPDNTSGSKIGIASFLDTFPNITDVKSFLKQYGVNQSAAFPQYQVVSINKGRTTITPNRGDLTVEPELDLDYSIAFTGPLDAIFFSTGGRGVQLAQPGNKPVKASQNEPYLEFLQYIVAQKSPPQVISISYSDDEQSVPQAYANRVCDLFAQAATRGISIIHASGDGGASGTGSGDCKGPDGKNRLVPTFPASCPWVTSVGATAGYGGAASFSSGGFSNYFQRPAWQNTSVAQYIKELNGKHKGLYNASGRGIPDVSLLGDAYLTLTAGSAGQHDGTSASTPVFAAMIALINDIRLRNKKPALGFLNPLLYASEAQKVYRDVSDGSQTVGCADGNTIIEGWEALKGWDAATGLGEPDFEKLKALLA